MKNVKGKQKRRLATQMGDEKRPRNKYSLSVKELRVVRCLRAQHAGQDAAQAAPTRIFSKLTRHELFPATNPGR